MIIVTFTNDHSSISFELASRYISSRSSTLANPRWINLALLFRPFTFLHRKRGEAYLRLDLKLKTIEKTHQTRNNHGMAKKDIKTSKIINQKNASHQELINVNSRSRLRAHVPGYPCSILYPIIS